jgi:hypothetical protein
MLRYFVGRLVPVGVNADDGEASSLVVPRQLSHALVVVV